MTKVEGGHKHQVDLFIPCEDAPAALAAAGQPFDLDSQLADLKVDIPFEFPVRLGRRDRSRPLVSKELAGLVAFKSAFHRQRHLFDRLVPALRQGVAFGRVVGLSGGKTGNHCQSAACCDHVDLRVPSAARFADALRPVF